MEFQSFINILAVICLIAILTARSALAGDRASHGHADTVSWNG